MTGAQLSEAWTPPKTNDFAVAAPTVPATQPLSTPPTSAAASAPAVPAVPSGSAGTAPAADATTGGDSAAAGTADSPPGSAPGTASAAAAGAARSAAPIPVGVPVGLQLPRLGVQAPVDPVGVVDGELQVPEDGKRLGWWVGSVAAGGRSGTTVIDGHIDTPQGRGAFYQLQHVEAHDQVVVTVAGGATVTYWVTERRTYAKADGLPPEVFGDAAGPPRLVLITCGGRYDVATASYDDNVVVVAVPA